jgi:dephospho-CoA kinase
MVKLEYAIALTGGIATGKSTTCNLLKLYGFHIIDADKIAHKILQEQKEEIKRVFGSEYVKDGVVDRKALGRLIFNNDLEREKLQNLLHPKIKEEIFLLAKKQERFKVPYFIDIPLFFETKNYEIDKVALVYAPKDIQIQRVMKRDNLSYEEAKKRVLLQMDIEKKKELANYVIENFKDLKSLQNEVEIFVERIKDEFSLS